ncbi:MAG TPA: transcriptional repressor [Firmicutes bacterium]|nr:transcriptional repressor [Bacillota bacterium]
MLGIKEKLAKHGITPSMQRLLIYQYILRERNHPNVDMTYSALREQIPALSRTTVYNNATLFAEKGLLFTLLTNTAETRYDLTEYPHSHFICLRRGTIYNIPPDIQVEGEMPDGFSLEKPQVYFQGTCKDCREI